MAVPQSVTIIGTGLMGFGMAHRLLSAGHEVTVWDRDLSRCQLLASEGARIASSAAEATRRGSIVITVLPDADATLAVMELGLPACPPDALWAQMGTVGPVATMRLADWAESANVSFLDAPLIGTKGPAQNGQLVVLASGPPEVLSRLQPLLGAISIRTLWVGDLPGAASSLKLVVNHLMLSSMVALGEALNLAQALDLEPELLLLAIAGGPLDSPMSQIKGRAMLRADFDPTFPLRLAAKDAHLISQLAGERGLELRVGEAAATVLSRALALGLGEEDVSALYSALERA
ncbi:MAG: NAD(P)-dependent oxidoreductase [Candidatus Dormibacteria bacterium]